jgi:hypothetical protein
MDWAYNLKKLKDDFEKGTKFTLFVGAGLNASKNVKLLWNDLIKQSCGYSFRRIGNNLSMNYSEINYLLQLLGVENVDIDDIISGDAGTQHEQIEKFIRHKDYATTHLPVEVQVSIIKTLLGDSYIPFLQDYLYSQCNKRKIHRAFEHYKLKHNHTSNPDRELYTLYVVARMILLNPQIESVISYNYDNFLSEAACYLIKHANDFFTSEEIKFLSKRYKLESTEKLYDVVPVVDYGTQNMCVKKKEWSIVPIYHVHGYIPSPDEEQYINAPKIILSMDEYCSTMRGDVDGSIAIQEQAIVTSNSLFVGLSVTDLSTKRILSLASENRRKNSIYILDAYYRNSHDSSRNIVSILRQIKNSYLESLGASFIDCDRGFEYLFDEIATIKDRTIIN